MLFLTPNQQCQSTESLDQEVTRNKKETMTLVDFQQQLDTMNDTQCEENTKHLTDTLPTQKSK